MGRIKKAYADLVDARTEYLNNAQFNERFTVMVGNNDDGTSYASVRQGMFDTIGTTITRALASTMISILYPPQVYWARLDLERKAGKKLTTEQLSLLEDGERNMMSLFDAMATKSISFLAFLHSIVGGNVVLHFLKEVKAAAATETEAAVQGTGPTRTRMFPLTQFVCEREGSWMKRLVVREPLFPTTEEEKKDGKFLYTEIDYINDTVKQEADGDDRGTADEFDGDLIDDKPVQWVMVTNEIPKTGQSYAPAYVDYYITKIMHSNMLARSFQMLVYEAAKLIKGVRPGSGLNPHEMERLQGGAWVEMEEGDILYPEQTAQLSPGIQYISAEKQQNNAELKTEFMFGLLDRQPQPETATLTRQLVSEMNNLGAQFFAHHQDHTQLDIAQALQFITGFTIKEGEEKVVPRVLTGQSALTRQQEAESMMMIIERLGTFDPAWAAEVPTGKIFQRLSDAFHIDMDDLNPDDVNAFDLLKQLVGLIRDDPQKVLPMIFELLSDVVPPEMMQQLVAGLAGGGATPAAAANNQPTQPQLVGATEQAA